ncbi:phosphoadenosine phosphosulfate reductase [Thioclava sp.]|uniref:phosphoadenosine phosphosulfate reductase n=1 Tax=Thioclava sp. TaxID=1933450 RepID=UPI003AA9036D
MFKDKQITMATLSESDWKARLEEMAEDSGYFEPLGAAHSVFFHDDTPTLLVTFETRAGIRADDDGDQLPRGYQIARAAGCSSLTLICDHDSWFRDPAVFAYFDRLVDEAFFEDFDRVVFYGAGPCGYAAAAFSVTAPGATVVALHPQATLDPAVTGWDDRFRQMRRISFTDRYGFAPEMLEGVGQAFVIYDPLQPLDAMHAALYARPCVSLLACRNIGENVEWMLRGMAILDDILIAACQGELSELRFWQLYRARRNLPRFLRQINAQLDAQNRPYLEAIVCRNVARRLNGPRFRARLVVLETELAEQGIALPDPIQIGAL